MKVYNWQKDDWPLFTYSLEGLDKTLLQIARNEGKYEGIVNTFPKNIRADTIIDLMVVEAIKTSEIEGEYYSRKDVLSSIKRNLGVHEKGQAVANKNAGSIGKMMVSVRNTFAKPITKKMLCEDWHATLFEHSKNIEVGKWRTHKEPMQVVSGALGKQKVHFEAPPSASVNDEMKRFVAWYNSTAPGGKAPIKNSAVRAAIAHVYFLSIHPFEDGNGRIGRALAEKALSQGIGKPALLSLSYAIEKNKKRYYEQLNKASFKNEITEWIHYFVKTIHEAQLAAERQINFTLNKVKFTEAWKGQLNDRQWKVIHRMMDQGAEGFEGGMNARKYMAITKASKATATRDLQLLQSWGVFSATGAGRNVGYALNLLAFPMK